MLQQKLYILQQKLYILQQKLYMLQQKLYMLQQKLYILQQKLYVFYATASKPTVGESQHYSHSVPLVISPSTFVAHYLVSTNPFVVVHINILMVSCPVILLNFPVSRLSF
jgi:hypothetical protein